MSWLSVDDTPYVRPPRAERLRDYEWLEATPFLAVHLLPLLAFFTGARWQDWVLCAALYWGRMFFVTATYHRYFAHRTFKTSRPVQFLFAFLAMTSSQKGILWWAAHHRMHHKESDRDGDPHDSRRGFWFSHLGWLYYRSAATDYARIKDFARFPELVLLNRLWVVPPAALGLAVWLLFGWSGLLIGFFLSTAILWHGTFTINSLSHIFGTQRYDAGDQSRNNGLLALITMGEGWHNNHHHFMGSTRQGFYWWEVDLTYYLLRALAVLGIVWDLREPPARVFDRARQLARPAPATAAPPVARAADVAPG